jgi:hypothetical protein
MKDTLPQAIYKYVTAEGLINILETGKLKWSAPDTFNDPFDLKMNAFRFDLGEFRRITEEKVNQFVFANEDPPGRIPQKFLTWRRERKNDPNITEDDLRRKIERFCNKLLEAEKDNRESIASKLDDALKKARVLCLTETYDDILMWGHYAKGHSGGVVKFKCENNLMIEYEGPFKVVYANECPDCNFISEYLDYTFEITDIHSDGKEYIYTKSDHWSYEMEWRLIKLASNENDQEFCEFSPETLEAIYLGCSMGDEIKKNILGLAGKNEYGHIDIYQVSTNPTEFKLDFNPI